jgi:hypothetical protein
MVLVFNAKQVMRVLFPCCVSKTLADLNVHSQKLEEAKATLPDVMDDEHDEYTAKLLALSGRVGGMILAHKDDEREHKAQRGHVKKIFEDALRYCTDDRHAAGKKHARIHVSLALFCDMEIDRAKAAWHNTEKEDFLRTYVKSMLKAMSFGSEDAKSHFPRVLELVQSHTNVVALEFSEGCKAVPAWMLLEWLPQIVSVFSTPGDDQCARLMAPLLLRISAVYPQTVFFALRVVRDDIRNIPGRTEQLQDVMHSPAADAAERFSRAMQLLQHPELQV